MLCIIVDENMSFGKGVYVEYMHAMERKIPIVVFMYNSYSCTITLLDNFILIVTDPENYRYYGKVVINK